MSWGYFIELDLRVPAAARAALHARRPVDVRLPVAWSGLRDRRLEAVLGRCSSKDQTFAQTLSWYRREGSRLREEASGERATLRVLTLLEKSILDEGHPLVALLFAAREHAGEGTLRLVNDGTAGGEAGVELTLANGTITSHPIEDADELAQRLGNELYALPALPPTGIALHPVTGLPILDPVTGEPIDLAELHALLEGSRQKVAAQAAASRAPSKKPKAGGTRAKASASETKATRRARRP